MITISLIVSLFVGTVIGAASKTQPNIVFFLVDDQDVMLNSLDAMQKTRELFTENGLKFYNGFSVTPVCCVSRSSMLLGRYTHNSLCQNNTVSGNCYSDGWIEIEEPYTYNNYLHQSGYKTLYSGKYLNNYGKGGEGSIRTYETVPQGWDEWYTLIGDAKFYNYQLSHNGELEEHADVYEDDYFPLLQKRNALSFLEKMSEEENSESPFLMVLGTPAAHKPWTPAPEYEYIVDDESMTAPRTLSWNYMNNLDKGAVLNSLDEMDEDLIRQSDEIYRRRHAILLTVDDMISEVYDKIVEMGELDNTYFIYTADHGFHVGQYGMTFGKRLLYDTDLRVPFYVSGPSVKKNGVTSAMALNIDIAPTIIELALGKDSIPSNMDGRSLVEFFDLTESEEKDIAISKQAFVVEYNGESPPYDMQESSYEEFMKQIRMNHDQGSASDSPSKHFEEMRHLLGTSSRPQNEWIMNCESQVNGLDGMNCDTWNNTYRCMRVIDGLKEETMEPYSVDLTTWESNMVSLVKGEVYCSYTCFDEYYVEAECMEESVEAMGEYYDLDVDVWQTINTMESLSKNVKKEMEDMLSEFVSCEGVGCRELRKQDSTWYKRDSSSNAESSLNSFNTQEDVVRHMSKLSYLIVAIMLVFGLSLAYVLYSRIMAKLTVKQIKYSKVATRPNYSSFGEHVPTQPL